MKVATAPDWAADDNQGQGQGPQGGNDEESVSFTKTSPHSSTGFESSFSSPAPSPDRTFAHRLYRVFKFVAMISALLLGIAQVVSVIFLPFDGLELMLKIFLTSFSVLVILNEAEWWSMMRNSPLLSNWITRGYFYVFIGLVSLEENNIDTSSNFATLAVDTTAAVFIETASWSICTVGALYFTFGLCCGQKYLGNTREQYSSRLKERKRIFDEGLRSDNHARDMIT